MGSDRAARDDEGWAGDGPRARAGPVPTRIDLERAAPLRRAGALPTEPVLLDDRRCRWPAHARWTPEHFAATVGHRRVTVDGVEHTVRDLLELIEGSTPEAPAPYLRAQKVADVVPELADDLTPMFDEVRPNWAESRLLPPSVRRAAMPEILLGGRGASFDGVHYDKDHLHAFISQMYGRKELFLCSPAQGDRLYPEESAPNQSPVDIHAPDLVQHPLFADAAVLTTTLSPGDTVFLPSGWWHTALMQETSISVTWNSVDAANWAVFSAATRKRVERRSHPAVGAGYGAYASAFGVLARARDRSRRRGSSPSRDSRSVRS